MAGRLRRPALGRRRTAALTLFSSVCVLALFGAFSGATRTSGAHRSSAAPLGGVNITNLSYSSELTQADRAIADARALHVKLVRTEVPWSVLEPRGADRLDPSALAFADRLVADAAASGIGVIMTVDSTPCWASSAPTSLLRVCTPDRANAASAWPPAAPGSYGAFVAYLARRYGSRLAAIEIWNEPDQGNEHYFAGPDKPQRYAEVLKAAYKAIKRASPNLPVLAGSLVGSNGAFLRALYAVGIKGYYDGLAVHFYTLVLASLRAIHEVQLANGDTKPLWLDEFGWSSCWPREHQQQEQACVTAPVQATNLANTFRALSRTPYIAAEIVYQLEGSAREDFGVLGAGGGRKPAFTSLSRALLSPLSSPSPVVLGLKRRRGRVIASGSGPVGDYMELEAFQGPTLRYKALFVLDRFNRYSIVLPRVLGTHGLRVRVFQYWAGTAKSAQRGI